ncbi:DMT family transporter [Sinobaca sp. H24]|uniref:DMT family transporter n=1 Tax=Sinobaca sp. H24 TaxID=2923376 RepID=UPI00207A08CB|nr:DMT family transporter [Sinobaca sp. H24]
MNGSSQWINYILLFGVMIMWGMNVTAIKVLVEYVPPAAMQSWRILLAGLVLAAIISVKGEWRRITKKQTVYIAFASLTGVTAHHLFLAFGLANTTAVNGSLIVALVPVFTSILALLILGDPFTRIKFIGIVSAFTGVCFVIIAGSDSGAESIASGDILMLAAVFAQALSFIFIRKATSDLSPRLVTGIMFIVGSMGLFLFSALLEPEGLPPLAEIPAGVWMIFLGSSVLATALGHQVFNLSIQKIGAGQTAVLIILCLFLEW